MANITNKSNNSRSGNISRKRITLKIIIIIIIIMIMIIIIKTIIVIIKIINKNNKNHCNNANNNINNNGCNIYKNDNDYKDGDDDNKGKKEVLHAVVNQKMQQSNGDGEQDNDLEKVIQRAKNYLKQSQIIQQLQQLTTCIIYNSATKIAMEGLEVRVKHQMQ